MGRERLEAQATKWRDDIATDIADASSYPAALVPYNAAVPTKLPAERREAFRAHLVNIATKAIAARNAATVDQREAAEPEVPARVAPSNDVLLHACGVCRGNCCQNGGGDRAYLSSETIERYLAEFPNHSVDEIAAAYLSHLADETLEGGCVFQHATGCTLPRQLRSDTCNNFLCTYLRNFQHRHGSDQPLRAFFVACQGSEMVQGAFVSSQLVQLVPFDETQR